MSKTRVFVSFDIEHDGELYEELRAHSKSYGFAVAGRSEQITATQLWSEEVRRKIREADQVIIICGEHTEASASVSAELRIAQQERTPYFMLWGRQEIMCTKPAGAKRDEGMYRWTPQILREQIAFTSRKVDVDSVGETVRNPERV